MVQLETLFKNHFDSKEVSDDELKKFAEGHLRRLTDANAGSLYDPMLLH